MYRSRSDRKINQDLELRLGPSFTAKGSMLAGNCGRDFPNLITIEDDDDDDDLFMYSPSPSSSLQTMTLYPISSSWVPVVTEVNEEDLELRLGPKAHNGSIGNLNRTANGVEHSPQTWKCVRTKFGLASSSRQRVMEVEEIKLRCTICMDTMKEETSTVCGHIFCKTCITDAIWAQNRCPTCRKELTISNIHRIYLPGPHS